MRIAILTGAGISAESGLGTFRDAGGIWSSYDLEEVATPGGFARDPGKVHEFYNARRQNMRAAKPNGAHFALCRLEATLGDRLTVITQNIDDLHERAGSRNVIHMHGELNLAMCNHCGLRWPAPGVMFPSDGCQSCGRHATRPDVVWFGEMPYHLERIDELLREADLFVAIGTSGQVYPASNFVLMADEAGAGTLELNLEPTQTTMLFKEARSGPATEIVPQWVDEVLGSL